MCRDLPRPGRSLSSPSTSHLHLCPPLATAKLYRALASVRPQDLVPVLVVVSFPELPNQLLSPIDFTRPLRADHECNSASSRARLRVLRLHGRGVAISLATLPGRVTSASCKIQRYSKQLSWSPERQLHQITNSPAHVVALCNRIVPDTPSTHRRYELEHE